MRATTRRAWAEVRRRYFKAEADWYVLPLEQRVRHLDAKTSAVLAHWAERLAAKGHDVSILEGGFAMWKEAGLPVKKVQAGGEAAPAKAKQPKAVKQENKPVSK